MLLSIARYYFHREEAIAKNKPIKTKWDKKADLDNIAAESEKFGWSFEACAGTFWFSRTKKNGEILTMMCNNTNVFDGGCVNPYPKIGAMNLV
jgi:hypothetical protein